MSFLLGWLSKKPEKKPSDSITIFVNDKKVGDLKIEERVTATEVCQKFTPHFANRNRNPDLRLMLSVLDKKDGSLVSKRILNPLEKVFGEHFRETGAKVNFRYEIIDLHDYPARQPIANSSSLASPSAHQTGQRQHRARRHAADPPQRKPPLAHLSVEHERHLRAEEDHLDAGRAALLRRQVRKYHSLSEENLCCIPLVCIQEIKPVEQKPGKAKSYCFEIVTSSEYYTIKCSNDLDWNTWFNNLVHCTNLAKESNLIKELNKRIVDNETIIANTLKNNLSYCDSKIYSDRKLLDRAFGIFLKHPQQFFPKLNDPAYFIPLLKDFSLAVTDAMRLKNDQRASLQFASKVAATAELLPAPVLKQLYEAELINPTFCEDDLAEEAPESQQTEHKMDRLLKIRDDLFQNLQKLSMTSTIFLREFFTKAEEQDLRQYSEIIT